jgi:hypothetical protein
MSKELNEPQNASVGMTVSLIYVVKSKKNRTSHDNNNDTVVILPFLILSHLLCFWSYSTFISFLIKIGRND